MSTYEYTDICGEKLEVEHRPVTGLVMVSAYTRNEADALVQIHVNVNPDDAPALALAVLEAADVGNLGKVRLVAALSQLTQYQADRQREAEREAEDDKVREFFLALNPGNFIAGDVEVDDRVREQYRAAREFFAQEDIVPAEIVEPRVLQHGDPEPDRSTKWQDADGDIMTYSGRYWHSAKPTGSSTGWARWQDWTADCFPWTEVL